MMTQGIDAYMHRQFQNTLRGKLIIIVIYVDAVHQSTLSDAKHNVTQQPPDWILFTPLKNSVVFLALIR